MIRLSLLHSAPRRGRAGLCIAAGSGAPQHGGSGVQHPHLEQEAARWMGRTAWGRDVPYGVWDARLAGCSRAVWVQTRGRPCCPRALVVPLPPALPARGVRATRSSRVPSLPPTCASPHWGLTGLCAPAPCPKCTLSLLLCPPKNSNLHLPQRGGTQQQAPHPSQPAPPAASPLHPPARAPCPPQTTLSLQSSHSRRLSALAAQR